MLGAYALGKAHRLLTDARSVDRAGLTHGAIENTNEVLRAAGLALPETIRVSPETKAKDHPGALVLADPVRSRLDLGGTVSGARASPRAGWRSVASAVGARADRACHFRPCRLGRSQYRDPRTGAERIFVTHGYTVPVSPLARGGRIPNAGIIET